MCLVRKRFWVVAGAVVLVVLVVVGVVVWLTRGLDREVTADPGGFIDVLDVPRTDVVFDDRAADTAYVFFKLRGQSRLAAIRAGSDEPLWQVGVETGNADPMLAVVDGALLVLTQCWSACEPVPCTCGR